MNKSVISLRIFLIKCTAIPIKFIDQHLIFYNACVGNPYGIEIRDVIKYLDIKKKEIFISRFRDRFVKNVDYITEEQETKRMVKGDVATKYYMTLDTFEKICMTTHTAKGNQVQDYFILLRKFIQYYNEHMLNMVMNSDKVVYIFAVNKKRNIYKIGQTSNLRKRLHSYITGREKHPDIQFIMQIDDPKKVEKCTQSLIDEYIYKEHQELYKIPFEKVRTAIFYCGLSAKNVDIIDDKNMDTYILFDTKFDDKLDKTMPPNLTVTKAKSHKNIKTKKPHSIKPNGKKKSIKKLINTKTKTLKLKRNSKKQVIHTKNNSKKKSIKKLVKTKSNSKKHNVKKPKRNKRNNVQTQNRKNTKNKGVKKAK